MAIKTQKAMKKQTVTLYFTQFEEKKHSVRFAECDEGGGQLERDKQTLGTI